MPSVTSIIDPVLALYGSGTIPMETARDKAVPAVLADKEATTECVREVVFGRIKSRATRHMRHVTNGDPRQASFFGNRLREAYALDLEERVVKPTSELLRAEFVRALQVRRTQLENDARHLAAMEEAYTALAPLWDDAPAATYGEVERLYLGRGKAA